MTPHQVGATLVELCQQGKHLEAIDTLYDDKIVSIEACEMPGHPRQMSGKKQVRDKSVWFFENHEIHGGEVKGPYPADDGRVAVWMSIDMTPKVGPMAGKRFTMEEVCLYTVKDGKVVKEEFFYPSGG